VANDIYLPDYPEDAPQPDQPEMFEAEEAAFQTALVGFLTSALIDYLGMTLSRYPTAAEALRMADQAQALRAEARLRGWTDPAADA
jgi:hypothetical protein